MNKTEIAEIVRAAKKGDTNRVLEIIDTTGMHIDAAVDRDQNTLLHIASSMGHETLVVALVERGANTNPTSVWRITPLHRCAARGFDQIASALIKHGADVDRVDDKGSTPLHWAAANEKVGTAKLLLAKTVNVDCANQIDGTAMHIAVRRGLFTLVEALLERGADVNRTDVDGKTPLEIARCYSIFSQPSESESMMAILQRAVRNAEVARLIGMTLLLKPLALPTLVVYTIYCSLRPNCQSGRRDMHAAWKTIAQIKHTVNEL